MRLADAEQAAGVELEIQQIVDQLAGWREVPNHLLAPTHRG